MNKIIREYPDKKWEVLEDVSRKQRDKTRKAANIATNNQIMKNKAKFIKDIETNSKYDVLGHQKPKTLERLKQEMAELSNENLQNKSDIEKINKSLSLLNDKDKGLKFEHENAMSQKPKALGKHLLAVGGTGAVGIGGYKAIKNRIDDR